MRCAYWLTPVPLDERVLVLRLDVPAADLDGVQLVRRRSGGRGSPAGRPSSRSATSRSSGRSGWGAASPRSRPRGWRGSGSSGPVSTASFSRALAAKARGGVPVLHGLPGHDEILAVRPEDRLHGRHVEALRRRDEGIRGLAGRGERLLARRRPGPASPAPRRRRRGSGRTPRRRAPEEVERTEVSNGRGSISCFGSVSSSSTSGARRRRREPPPPREPALEAPLELLARALWTAEVAGPATKGAGASRPAASRDVPAPDPVAASAAPLPPRAAALGRRRRARAPALPTGRPRPPLRAPLAADCALARRAARRGLPASPASSRSPGGSRASPRGPSRRTCSPSPGSHRARRRGAGDCGSSSCSRSRLTLVFRLMLVFRLKLLLTLTLMSLLPQPQP